MTKKSTPHQQPPADRLIPMSKVIDLTSLSKATVYRKVADRSFPAPLKIGKSRVAWLEADVAAWIKSRTRVAVADALAAQQGAA